MPSSPWNDFSMLAAQGQTPEQNYGAELQKSLLDPQKSGEEQYSPELQRSLGQLADFGARLSVQQKMSEQPTLPSAATFKDDGTVDLKGVPRDTYEGFMRDRQELNSIRGAFLQRDAELKAQAEAIKAQPAWIQLATALSANLANQPNMPGWVRGMGQTAAQLNPQASQIEAQRMQLLGPRAQLAEKMGALDIQEQQLTQAREDKKALIATKVQDDLTRIEKDASVGARTRGDFDSATYIAEMVSKGQNPQQAVAGAARLDNVAKITRARIEAVDAAKTTAEAQKTKQFYDALQARSDNTDKMIASAEKRAADAAARGEAKTSAADAAKALKASEPGPVLKKQLADLNAADNALNEIENLLNDPKNQSLMGPFAGRARSGGAAVGIDPGGAVAGLKQKLMLQTAQAIKATGAGARGFGPQERPYFEQLSEGINRLPAQNLKIIQGWREFLDQERRGIQVANPDVFSREDGKYLPTLGKRLAPDAATVSAPAAGAKDAGGPHNKVTPGKRLVFNPASGLVEEK